MAQNQFKDVSFKSTGNNRLNSWDYAYGLFMLSEIAKILGYTEYQKGGINTNGNNTQK